MKKLCVLCSVTLCVRRWICSHPSLSVTTETQVKSLQCFDCSPRCYYHDALETKKKADFCVQGEIEKEVSQITAYCLLIQQLQPFPTAGIYVCRVWDMSQQHNSSHHSSPEFQQKPILKILSLQGHHTENQSNSVFDLMHSFTFLL